MGDQPRRRGPATLDIGFVGEIKGSLLTPAVLDVLYEILSGIDAQRDSDSDVTSAAIAS